MLGELVFGFGIETFQMNGFLKNILFFLYYVFLMPIFYHIHAINCFDVDFIITLHL